MDGLVGRLQEDVAAEIVVVLVGPGDHTVGDPAESRHKAKLQITLQFKSHMRELLPGAKLVSFS
jgi:hypothetical protein